MNRGRKHVNVFKGTDDMEEEEWTEMLSSSVEGNGSTFHATIIQTTKKNKREKNVAKSSVGVQPA